TLLPGLLKTLSRNAGRGQADVGLFEFGSVFLPAPGERPKAPHLAVDHAPSAEDLKQLEAALPDQPLHLGLVAAGRRPAPAGWGPGRAVVWADAIEACRIAAESVGLTA